MARTTQMARTAGVALTVFMLAVPGAGAAELRLGIVGTLDGIDDPLVRPGEGLDLVRALVTVPLVGVDPRTHRPDPGTGVAAGWNYLPGTGLTFRLRDDAGLGPAQIANDLATLTDSPDSEYASALAAVDTWQVSGTDVVAGLDDRSWSLLGSGAPVANAPAAYILTRGDRTSALLQRARGSGPERIAVTAFASGDALADALVADQIDAADGIPRARFARLGATGDVLTYRAPAPAMTLLAFGGGSPVARDTTLRRALALVINRGRLVASALDGLGEPARAAVLGAFYGRPPLALARHDVAEARDLLERNDWVRGSDGVRARAGERAALQVLVRTNAPDELAATRLVAGMAREVGIELQLLPTSPGVVQDRMAGRGSFEALVTSLSGTPEPGSLLRRFLSTDESNLSGYGNSDYDSMYERQDKEVDPAQRSRLIGDMERVLLEESPAVFLYSRDRLMAVRTARFEGWRATPSPVGLPVSPYTPRPMDELRAREPGRSYGGPYVAAALLLGLAFAGLALRGLRTLARRRQPLEHSGDAA